MATAAQDRPSAEALLSAPRARVPATAERTAARATLGADALVAAAALAVEAVLAAGALWDRMAIGWLLLGHAAVIAALAVWLRRRIAQGGESSRPQLILLSTLVAGPVGALGSLVVLPRVCADPTPSALLDAWYERIALSTEVDPATQLAERVATGRILDADAPPPRALYAVMLRGSLPDRQKALGLIARDFDPAYGPALQAALKSPEPVVRVQAAAVAARVRGSLKADVKRMLADVGAAAASPALSVTRAARLAACARSGLLDAGDRLRAEAAVTRLRAAAVHHAAEGRLVGTVAVGRSLIEAQEAERALIAAGRARELRLARRFSSLLRRGHWRIRRRTRGSPTRAAASWPRRERARR